MFSYLKSHNPLACPAKFVPISRETARLLPRLRRIALLADTPVSRGTVEQVFALCRRMTASLVVIAPADRALATSILEEFLPSLEQAAVEWDIAPLGGDLYKAAQGYLATHAEIELVVCDGRSRLAQAILDGRGAGRILPTSAPILLIVESGATPRPTETPEEIDWLHPDLNRGF